MKQYNYKCVVAKNGTKMYYKRVHNKWKRISNTCGIKVEKGKKKYRDNGEEKQKQKQIIDNIKEKMQKQQKYIDELEEKYEKKKKNEEWVEEVYQKSYDDMDELEEKLKKEEDELEKIDKPCRGLGFSTTDERYPNSTGIIRKPKCDGKEDLVMGEKIPVGSGYCLDNNCYDRSSLSKLLIPRKSPTTRRVIENELLELDILPPIQQQQQQQHNILNVQQQQQHNILNVQQQQQQDQQDQEEVEQMNRLSEIEEITRLNNIELLDFLRTTTITELPLRGNLFTGDFRRGFLQALEENDTFTSLHMNTDDVGFAIMRGLYEILADKLDFEMLYVDRNPHSEQHARRILGDDRVTFYN